MCACRCGINVHIKDNKVSYIEGNKDHPVNRGVLCAKGSAGIMQINAPSKLKSPLRRVGPRGSGQFEEVTWDEALNLATSWLKPIRDENPEKLAFFTGRDQSQSFTSFWAQNFGTPNYAAHGGFCSVNMAAAGIYTMGGAFWEFGQPDWEHTKFQRTHLMATITLKTFRFFTYLKRSRACYKLIIIRFFWCCIWVIICNFKLCLFLTKGT